MSASGWSDRTDWSTVPPMAAGLERTAVRPTARSRIARGLLVALAVVVMAALGLLVLLLVGSDTGAVGFVAGFAFALVPVAIVVPALLWLDRLEAEPVGQLLFAFGWGAVVATFVALLVNSYSLAVINASGGTFSTTSVVVAPWVEETAKGLGVLVILLWRRRDFDGVVDGIVYAGLVGCGFAFTENVLYLGRSLQESGTAGLALTFVLRGVFGPFAHPMFTMATGVGLGVASRTARPPLRVVAPLLGLVVAVILHGLWNLSAVAGLRGFASLYVLVQVPLFAAAVGIAIWARRREARLVGLHLRAYAAAGWFTPDEVIMLASHPLRRKARAWAKQVGGSRGARAMRGFQAAATELAFARDRATRATLDGEDRAIEQHLLAQVSAQRFGSEHIDPSLRARGDSNSQPAD
jgi:RsiW-degrading membrane proteinase PrsW (M82 family)